jgi:hypothetical protein
VRCADAIFRHAGKAPTEVVVASLQLKVNAVPTPVLLAPVEPLANLDASRLSGQDLPGLGDENVDLMALPIHYAATPRRGRKEPGYGQAS